METICLHEAVWLCVVKVLYKWVSRYAYEYLFLVYIRFVEVGFSYFRFKLFRII